MVSGHAPGPAVVAVTIVFTVVANVAVALRLYTRLILAHNAGYEDALIALAAITTIALAVCTCLEVHYAIGKHQWTVSLPDLITFLRTLYASIILYNVRLTMTKFSILVQYLRIFPQNRFRIATYVVMVLVFVYFNWAFWSAVFNCIPVSGFWDLTMPEDQKKCLRSAALWFANAGMNIITDIAVTVLPLPMFSHLNIPKRPKIGLMLVFGLGGVVCIISILRLESLYAVTTQMHDQTYNNGLPAMWSVVELNTSILCSCLPTLKTLVSQAFPKIFSTQHHSRPSRVEGAARYGSKGGITHEEIGRGWSGRGDPAMRAYVSRGSRASVAYDMDELGCSPKDINVVTVVHQEVEKTGDESGRSDHESTRDLIQWASFSE